MAIYVLSAKVISRTNGRSAVAAAAYRSGERLLNERDGRAHDFRARSGVETTFIAGPEAAPSWAFDRQALWSAVELHEVRGNATTAREWMAALPAELDASQREALSRQFAAAMVERFGIVADCSIHAPSAEGDQRNHHLHMLTTTREVNALGFGAKTRELDGGRGRGGAVDEVRGMWADLCNRALEAAQVSARVDHRSLAVIRAEALEEAEEATAALKRAEKRLNPLGKRERVQEALESAQKALERVEGLPEAPGTHKGPERTARERREAAERVEANRLAAIEQQTAERRAIEDAIEANPPRIGYLTHRAAERVFDLFKEMKREGVRRFVTDRLAEATDSAKRFFERISEMGMVQPRQDVDPHSRPGAHAVGLEVEQSVRGDLRRQADLAWAATSAEEDMRVVASPTRERNPQPVEDRPPANERDLPEAVEDRQAQIDEIKRLAKKDILTTDEKIKLIETVDKVLDRDPAHDLKVGNTRVLEDFGDREKQLDLGEKYLKAEQEFGRERTGSLANLAKDREIFALEKEHAYNEEMKRDQELANQRKRDRGWEL